MNRKQWTRRAMWVLSLVILVLTGFVQPSGSSFAEETQGASQDSISPARDGVTLTAAKPWTREEMLAAKPHILEVAPDARVATRRSTVMNVPNATPGFEAGGAPQGAEAQAATLATPGAVDKMAAELQSVAGPYSYPPPYTRYEVFTGLAHPNTYAVWPYTTVGKLFFRQYGVGYVCSASSIGNRAIITAGHCIHAGNNRADGWSTDVVFVPAYKDGYAPYGQWSAANVRVMTAWYRSGNPGGLRRDVGGAIMNTNQYGQTLSQVVGWMGFAWNWGYTQHLNSFGYPQAAPFNGLRMNVCQGSYAYYSTDQGPSNAPVTRAIGCDMTGGSSGGPWVWQFGTGNYVNGVNSFKRNGYSEEMFSPYFDDAIKNMKDCLVNENC